MKGTETSFFMGADIFEARRHGGVPLVKGTETFRFGAILTMTAATEVSPS